MTGTRRIERRETSTALVLTGRREARRVLVPELMPDERRAPACEVDVVVPPYAGNVDGYQATALGRGLLVDVYG